MGLRGISHCLMASVDAIRRNSLTFKIFYENEKNGSLYSKLIYSICSVSEKKATNVGEITLQQ